MLPGSSWCCRVTSNSPDDLGTLLFTFPSPSPRELTPPGRTEFHHCCAPAPGREAGTQLARVGTPSPEGESGPPLCLDLSANCRDVKVLDWLSSKGRETWRTPFYLRDSSFHSLKSQRCPSSMWSFQMGFPLDGNCWPGISHFCTSVLYPQQRRGVLVLRVPALCPSCAGLSQRKESLSLGLLPWIPYTCGDQIL